MSEVNANPGNPTPTATGETQNPAQTTGVTAGNPGSGDPIKEAAAEAIRKHKLKVDGQEIEVDDEELKRGYSHQRAANKILQEGKAAKKQAETFVQMMKDKQKLKDALIKLGHNPRALAEEMLAAELEDEMLDPREKELRAAKMKLQEYEDLDKKQKEEVLKRRDAELKAKFAEDYTKQFTEALKESKLPPTKEMVASMAKYISRAAKLNFQMTAKEAAQLVREDVERAQANLYGDADAETLLKLIGEAGVQKIRAHDTAKLKDPMAHLKTPQGQGEAPVRSRNTGKRMTPAEWRKFNRS